MRQCIVLYILQLFTSFSINMMLVILTSLIYDKHGNVSILMISMILPSLLFSKIFGFYLDRHNPKKLLISVFVLEILFLTIILICRIHQKIWILYVFAFLTYFVDMLVNLYLQIAVTYISICSNYLKINSLLNSIENSSVILGPLCGGILIEYYSDFYSLVTVDACFIITLMSVCFLDVPAKRRKSESTILDVRSTILNQEQNSYKIKKVCYILCLFAFAIGVVNVRQIAFALAQYNMGDFGYSLTESAWGLGMVIGCAATVFVEKVCPYRILGLIYLLVGITLILLAINGWFIFGLFLFLLIGVGNIVVSIVTTTLIQQLSDKDSVGKSLGMKNMYLRIFTIAAMGLAGLLEPAISSVFLYGTAGITLILGGTLVLFFL